MAGSQRKLNQVLKPSLSCFRHRRACTFPIRRFGLFIDNTELVYRRCSIYTSSRLYSTPESINILEGRVILIRRMPSAGLSRADTYSLPSPLLTERERIQGSGDEADVDQVSKFRGDKTVEPSSCKRLTSSPNTVRRISGCIPHSFSVN